MKRTTKKILRRLFQPICDYIDEWTATEFKIRSAKIHANDPYSQRVAPNYLAKWLAFNPAPDFSWKLMDWLYIRVKKINRFLTK